MNNILSVTVLALGLLFGYANAMAQNSNKTTSGNPICWGWYADPEGVVFDDECWIYPTTSIGFGRQLYADALSSKDMVNWTIHKNVISWEGISWLKNALWAPSVVKKGGKYYYFFGGNNIQNNEQLGGIGVAVADNPAGPFKDAIGIPLIDKIVNNAQPIDQCVFLDDDGQYYMYYGGWGHCNVVKLNNDLVSLGKFADGQTVKEITPQNYVEGPFMLKRDGKYYFMWSEGNWTASDYHVAYAISDSPLGPFKREGIILESDGKIGTGAGHHSVVKAKGKNEYYIVYHRHPLYARDGNHRLVCVDKLEFAADGHIKPVKMTNTGVRATKF